MGAAACLRFDGERKKSEWLYLSFWINASASSLSVSLGFFVPVSLHVLSVARKSNPVHHAVASHVCRERANRSLSPRH